MFSKFLAIFLLLFSFSTQIYASNKVVIIGGGPTLKESQASIEINTKWIIDIVKEQSSGHISNILYTDGNKPGIDVYQSSPSNASIDLFLPLARVYGNEAKNYYHYFSSKVADDVSPSTYQNVTDKLKSTFDSLQKDDELLIIFQGHGGYNSSDTNGNFLRLWNDEKLSVSNLGKLMFNTRPESTIRFLFPQCFSGAFANLVYEKQQYANGLVKGMRCGFLAQREDLGSEGCTSSIDTESYRDYSSYFFSAFAGKSISNISLKQNPDWNNDGVITLKDAHLYALTNAFSVDYSLSTSDDYLQKWLPWYLKLAPSNTEPDNFYTKVAIDIAELYKINGAGDTLISNVSTRMKQLERDISHNLHTKKEFKKTINKLQVVIKNELTRTWPQIDSPHTYQYRKLLNESITHISDAIVKHTKYQTLADNQIKLAKLIEHDLNTRRELVQMLKILRIRKLGRTLSLFQTFASDREKSEYSRLLKCEEATL